MKLFSDWMNRSNGQAAHPDAGALKSLAHVEGPRTERRFLTVILRTTGERNETLLDALATLAAQSDDDFEVALVVHSAEPSRVAGVQALVGQFAGSFVERISIIPVTDGGRSRPLNVGLAAANGEYVTFLDDDDVVFCHWVEEFKAGARRQPGAIVRAACADQSFVRRATAHTPFEPCSGTSLPRSSTFDPLQHFHHNESPICSIALPLDVLRDHGLTFDEGLPVVEDWDLLLRTMMLTGVASRPEPTSIYRRWESDNSAAAHSAQLWRTTRDFVLVKLDQQPVLLPPGSASRLADAFEAPLGGGPAYTEAVARLAHLEVELDAAQIRLADAELRYRMISQSEWWRATRPLRAVGTVVKRLLRGRPSTGS